MSNEFIAKFLPEFEKTVEHFKKELSGLRAGRATPAMVENILVDAYGVKTPMMQLASISSPEPRQLLIEPWDKNLIKEIEKALSYANLGLAVRPEKSGVRITVPQMTEENRVELV
ncbi:MAG: ribosome recycling factor, partial [Parcubacteria group bacterium]